MVEIFNTGTGINEVYIEKWNTSRFYIKRKSRINERNEISSPNTTRLRTRKEYKYGKMKFVTFLGSSDKILKNHDTP